MRVSRWRRSIVLASVAAAASAVAAGGLGAPDVSAATQVAVEYKTRIIDLRAPVKAEMHSNFRVSGVVQEWDGSQWTAADYPMVNVYYQVLPSTKWIKEPATPQASTGGSFFYQQTQMTPLGHIRWKAVVPRQQYGNEILDASTSVTLQTWVVDHTYEEGVYTFRDSTYTNVEAYILDEPPGPGGSFSGYPVPGIAQLYYHPRGTTRWTYLGSQRTGGQGFVGWSTSKPLTGYFKIVYPAQGNYLGSSAEVKVG